MSKVERIELYHVSVPLDKPFFPSWIPGYPQTHARYTLIRVFTDDGLVGVSAGKAQEVLSPVVTVRYEAEHPDGTPLEGFIIYDVREMGEKGKRRDMKIEQKQILLGNTKKRK